MKSRLPLKLGIGVVALFALVIAGYYGSVLIRYRYWRSRLVSENNTDIEKALEKLIALEPKCRKWLVQDALETENPYAFGAAIVLANAGKFDFKTLGRKEFIGFAGSITGERAKVRITENYLNRAKNHYISFRPEGPSPSYYNLLYRFHKEAPMLPFDADGQTAYYEPPRAICFLRSMQGPDGRWCSEDGTLEGDVITTAFSLLAFYNFGHTHRHGKHRNLVKKGLEFLIRTVSKDCAFSDDLLAHAAAAILISDAYAVTRDKWLLQHAENALEKLFARQLNEGGFPRLMGEDESDIRTTCYAVFAIRTAAMGKIQFDKNKLEMVLDYVDKIPTENLVPRDAAMLLLTSIFCGRSVRDKQLSRYHRIMDNNLPSVDRPNDIEYLYFGAWGNLRTNPNWEKWWKRTSDSFRKQWKFGVHLDGSWNPDMGEFSKKYGRVYTTALCSLTWRLRNDLRHCYNIIRSNPRLRNPVRSGK
ncbi:MAG: prenyltransferase/squalene oxidase repeat-containing protein [Planctomycetota bacterium]|jgi:hypothetical protein